PEGGGPDDGLGVGDPHGQVAARHGPHQPEHLLVGDQPPPQGPRDVEVREPPDVEDLAELLGVLVALVELHGAAEGALRVGAGGISTEVLEGLGGAVLGEWVQGALPPAARLRDQTRSMTTKVTSSSCGRSGPRASSRARATSSRAPSTVWFWEERRTSWRR